MKSLKPEELESLLRHSPIIVDVRPATRFAAGSLEGAVNISMDDIKRGKHQLPKDRRILLVCERGIQSELAGLYLEADGYNQVWNFEGGLNALNKP